MNPSTRNANAAEPDTNDSARLQSTEQRTQGLPRYSHHRSKFRLRQRDDTGVDRRIVAPHDRGEVYEAGAQPFLWRKSVRLTQVPEKIGVSLEQN